MKHDTWLIDCSQLPTPLLAAWSAAAAYSQAVDCSAAAACSVAAA